MRARDLRRVIAAVARCRYRRAAEIQRAIINIGNNFNNGAVVKLLGVLQFAHRRGANAIFAAVQKFGDAVNNFRLNKRLVALNINNNVIARRADNPRRLSRARAAGIAFAGHHRFKPRRFASRGDIGVVGCSQDIRRL